MNLKSVVIRNDGQEHGHERDDGGEGVSEWIEGVHDLEFGAAETNNEVWCCFVLKSMVSLTKPQMSVL